MNKLSQIFEDNKSWAKEILSADPEFFHKLSKQQNPDYLWIGCADSRVPANQIMNLPPGDVFVHRNIANVIVHTDLNALSVIQYAVEVLEVTHIIVCGHYGCGGVKASMSEIQHGLIDNWLRHIKDVQRFHEKELTSFTDETQKFDRLCELNVLEQVRNVENTTIVKNTLSNGKELHVHAWIYDIKDGLLKDLKLI
ncbi:MAG: carbonate dehydratase [Sulfurimonas sp.]|nr:MAG: carbonate dehydratase [Sulfurimonas sp.]